MRYRIATAILLLITLLLAACNAAPKRSIPEPTPAPTEEMVLKLYQEPDSPFEPMLDVLVAGFAQQYPQYRVERVSLTTPGDDGELYRALLAGKIDLLPVDSWDDRLPRGANPQVWGLADLPTEDLVRIWLEGQTDRPAWQATDQELQSALQFFGAMVRLDKSVQPPAVRPWEINVRNPPVDFLPFFEGRIAMALGVYLDGFYDTLELPFATEFALIPSHTGRRPSSLGHIRALTIGSGSKHPDAAWEFVRFATGADGAKLLASKGVLPMYLTEEITSAWFSRSPAPPAFTESFFTTDWFFYAAEEWNGGAGVADVLLLMDLNRMSNRALAQEMDVAEAIKHFRSEAARSQDKARPR